MFSSSRNIVHPASGVEASHHDPRTLQLLNLTISPELLDYVMDCVVDVVRSAFTNQQLFASFEFKTLCFSHFLTSVVVRSRVSVATLLVSLLYIDRCRNHLKILQPCSEWLCENVFLGSFILAHKYTNDSWMRAATWAQLTGLFTTRQVVRAEREYLHVLDFNLGIQEHDILRHYEDIMARFRRPAFTSPTWPGLPPAATTSQPYRPSARVKSLHDSSPQTSAGSSSPLDTPPILTPPPPSLYTDYKYPVRHAEQRSIYADSFTRSNAIPNSKFPNTKQHFAQQPFGSSLDDLLQGCDDAEALRASNDNLMNYRGVPQIALPSLRSETFLIPQFQLPHMLHSHHDQLTHRSNNIFPPLQHRYFSPPIFNVLNVPAGHIAQC